ncbi:MAG: hypothetical protein AB8B83_07595 [Bdellovibrionales bacterium]
MKRKLTSLTLAALATTTVIAACSAPTAIREEVAYRLASPAWMNKRTINTGDFNLTAFERMHEKNKPVTLYIEGDGTADRSSQTGKTNNPTPINPVALHLATRDKSDNVAYLARPCQYTGMVHYDHSTDEDKKQKKCDPIFWGSARFSPEVIAAYNSALDNISRQFSTKNFHLVGYDGGGAIAAILAAQRDDVLTLRTVAGNLDHDAQSVYLGIAPLNNSLNAIDFAGRLKDVPQHHFIGGQDETVKPAVLHSYLQAVGESQCVEYTMIQEAEHARGWVEKWPDLLKADLPMCEKTPVFEPMEKPDLIYVPRMSGDKK